MAIKFWLLLLSFLSLLPCTVKAQKTDSAKANQFISLQFGLNKIKDENLLPKVSTGTITELSYGFEKRKTNLQQFHFTVGYSRLKTEFEDLSKTANLELNMDYNLGYQLAQKNNFTYYLGPEMRLSYNACYSLTGTTAIYIGQIIFLSERKIIFHSNLATKTHG